MFQHIGDGDGLKRHVVKAYGCNILSNRINIFQLALKNHLVSSFILKVNTNHLKETARNTGEKIRRPRQNRDHVFFIHVGRGS